MIDPGVEDKRLLVLEFEFAGALTMMRRPGSVLSRVIRDAWDCRDLAVLTKTTRPVPRVRTFRSSVTSQSTNS